jgi:hypothetical protein
MTAPGHSSGCWHVVAAWHQHFSMDKTSSWFGFGRLRYQVGLGTAQCIGCIHIQSGEAVDQCLQPSTVSKAAVVVLTTWPHDMSCAVRYNLKFAALVHSHTCGCCVAVLGRVSVV